MITQQQIDSMSLIEYITALNGDGPNGLTTDLSHWAEYGITTANELGDYLDACVAEECKYD